MGLITGIGAAIQNIRCLQQFKIRTFGMDNAVACSDSDGAVVRATANKDWMGVARGMGHTPPKLPGETFQLTAVDRAGKGWQSAASGTIVDRVHIFCDANEGKLFYYDLYFSANGSLTANDSLGAITATPPTPYASTKLGIAIDEVASTGIGKWDFDIRGNTSAPVWHSDSDGWPNRGAGNFDAIVRWLQYFDSAAGLPALNASSKFWLYTTLADGTTAATYWEVKWAQILQNDMSYVIDPGDNKTEYVRSDGEARFSSHVGGVKGNILRPDGTTYWP